MSVSVCSAEDSAVEWWCGVVAVVVLGQGRREEREERERR